MHNTIHYDYWSIEDISIQVLYTNCIPKVIIKAKFEKVQSVNISINLQDIFTFLHIIILDHIQIDDKTETYVFDIVLYHNIISFLRNFSR